MPDKKRPLKYHPLANLFPLIEGAEYEALKAGIAANAHPIVICLLDGKILDGRNRHRACRDLGIEPEFREFDGPGSPLDFVVTMNMNRRHLSSSQRAAVAVDVEEFLAKEGKQRRRAAAGGGKQAKKPEIFPESSEGEARERAATLAGTNPHYVSDAKKIKKEAPELFEELRTGNKTLPQVKRMRAAARKAESAAVAEPADSEATAEGSSTDGAPASTTDGQGTTPPDDAGTDGTADPTTDGPGTTPPDDDPEPAADDPPSSPEELELHYERELKDLYDRLEELDSQMTFLTLTIEQNHSSPRGRAVAKALQKMNKKHRSYFLDFLQRVAWSADKLRKTLSARPRRSNRRKNPS